MHREKENDLESVMCYKPRNCKTPERKRKRAAQMRIVEPKRLEVVGVSQRRDRGTIEFHRITAEITCPCSRLITCLHK